MIQMCNLRALWLGSVRGEGLRGTEKHKLNLIKTGCGVDSLVTEYGTALLSPVKSLIKHTVP